MVSATHIYKFDAKHTILFSFQFPVLFLPLKLLYISVGGFPRWLTARVDDEWYSHKDYRTDDKHQEPHRVATNRYLRWRDEAEDKGEQ